jgi:hypothetical protein
MGQAIHALVELQEGNPHVSINQSNTIGIQSSVFPRNIRDQQPSALPLLIEGNQHLMLIIEYFSIIIPPLKWYGITMTS